MMHYPQGYWEDDDRCGEGELTYNTGEVYKGGWRDDKQSKFRKHHRGNLNMLIKVMFNAD